MSSTSLQILGSFEKLQSFWVQSDTESQLSQELKRILDGIPITCMSFFGELVHLIHLLCFLLFIGSYFSFLFLLVACVESNLDSQHS